MLIFTAFAVGFGMAFAIGANDVANSMATAVGARAITPRQAVFIASILEFLGASLFGAHVTTTIAKGIVDLNQIGEPRLIVYGAFAALISSAIWIIFATLWGLPVSTTHSIVGGMIGFGIVAAGWEAINWFKMIQIVITWIVSPLVGGLLSFVIFKVLTVTTLHRKEPANAAKFTAPVFIGIAFFTMASLFVAKTLKKPLSVAVYVSLPIAILAFLISWFMVRRFIMKNGRSYETVEKVFKNAQVITSCYVSFSHGANDVANAVGPLELIYVILRYGGFSGAVNIPVYLLIFGGLGIALGISLMGYRVMKTVGEDITELNNTRGFSIDFATATTVLIASATGMPVSTTHTVVGAVTGVGLARGVEVVNVGILKNIALSWLLTVPLAGIVSALIFTTLR